MVLSSGIASAVAQVLGSGCIGYMLVVWRTNQNNMIIMRHASHNGQIVWHDPCRLAKSSVTCYFCEVHHNTDNYIAGTILAEVMLARLLIGTDITVWTLFHNAHVTSCARGLARFLHTLARGARLCSRVIGTQTLVIYRHLCLSSTDTGTLVT